MADIKQLGGVAGIAAIVAVGLGWKFWLGPTLAIRAEAATGRGWDDARSELTNKYVMTSGFDAASQKETTTCAVDKAIATLNESDCRYKYNTSTQTEASHLAEQDACLKKLGWEQKESKIWLECAKKHFPEDWQVMRGVLVKEFSAALKAQGATVFVAPAQCIADGVLGLVAEKKCKLVNREAEKLEELLNTVDACLGEEGMPKVAEISTKCVNK